MLLPHQGSTAPDTSGSPSSAQKASGLQESCSSASLITSCTVRSPCKQLPPLLGGGDRWRVLQGQAVVQQGFCSGCKEREKKRPAALPTAPFLFLSPEFSSPIS